MKLSTIFLTSVSAGAMLITGMAASTAAYAQDDDEIVVTALRREQNLQDVPAAVTAITADDIEANQVADVQDLQYLVPNISIASGTGTANSARIFLRGVGEDESRGAVDPAVGIYVDGIYMGRQVGSLMDVVDLERIEVLRGPQGTLYGRNTNGGAIKLVSKKPGGENAYRVGTTIGNNGRVDVRGMANFAMGENTGLRISGLHRTRDGFHELNPNGTIPDDGRSFGDWNVFALRGVFAHDFGNGWDMLLTADVTEDNSDPVPDSAAPPNDTDGNLFTIEPLPGVTCDAAGPVTFRPLGCFTFYDNETSSNGVSLNLTGDLGTHTFQSLTGYRTMEDDLVTRIGFPYFQETDQDQLSQEFVLTSNLDGPFNYVTGFYYFTEDVQLDTTFVFPFELGVDTESYSVFAHGTYDLSDATAVQAGVRYTDETKDLDARNVAFFDATTGAFGSTDSADFDNTSITVGIDHDFNDNVMGYAKYAQGFKSGGWSPDCFGPTACFLPVTEEELDSFEFGVKTTSMDNRLRFNATYFFNTYEGLQIGATVPGLGFTRFNVDETEISGFEFEADFQVTDNFRLFGNLGILDAEYTEATGDQARGLTNNGVPCDAGVDPTVDAQIIDCALGLELKNAPEYKGIIGAEYVAALETGQLTFTGDMSYEDDSWSLVANSPAHALTDVDPLFNARIAYEPSNANWRVAVWAKNIGDEEYWRAASANSFTAYAADPQTYGIDLDIEF